MDFVWCGVCMCVSGELGHGYYCCTHNLLVFKFMSPFLGVNGEAAAV